MRRVIGELVIVLLVVARVVSASSKVKDWCHGLMSVGIAGRDHEGRKAASG